MENCYRPAKKSDDQEVNSTTGAKKSHRGIQTKNLKFEMAVIVSGERCDNLCPSVCPPMSIYYVGRPKCRLDISNFEFRLRGGVFG